MSDLLIIDEADENKDYANIKADGIRSIVISSPFPSGSFLKGKEMKPTAQTVFEIVESVTTILKLNPNFQSNEGEVQFIKVQTEKDEDWLIHLHFAYYEPREGWLGSEIAKSISDAVKLLTGYDCVTHLWRQKLEVSTRENTVKHNYV